MKHFGLAVLFAFTFALIIAPAQTAFRALEPYYYNTVCGVTTTYAITATGCYIVETTGASTFTVTLPTLASVPIGKTYNLKHLGTGVITLSGNGAETIDGAVTWTLSTRYQSLSVYKNAAGTAWSIQ